jgi:hypothetical protein
MSTRCHTIITKSNDKVYVYRHCDGDPDGAGEDLKDFIDKHINDFKDWNPYDFAHELCCWNSQFEFEDYRLHGDESYIYFLNMDDMTLECYNYSWDLPEAEIKTKMELQFKETFGTCKDFEILTAAKAREMAFENIGNDDIKKVMEKIYEAAELGNFDCIYPSELSYPTIIKLRELGYDVQKVSTNVIENTTIPAISTKIQW